MSGIKGYFATVKISTDATTQPGGNKGIIRRFITFCNIIILKKMGIFQKTYEAFAYRKKENMQKIKEMQRKLD